MTEVRALRRVWRKRSEIPPTSSVIPAPERESAPRCPQRREPTSPVIAALRRGNLDERGLALLSAAVRHSRAPFRRPKLDLGPIPNAVRSAGGPSCR